MQLRLTADEIRLLYEILQAGAENLCKRLSRADNGDISPTLAAPQVARSLDFDSDELDCVIDLARALDVRIRQQISTEDDPDIQRALQLKQVVLRSLSDKICEACAML